MISKDEPPVSTLLNGRHGGFVEDMMTFLENGVVQRIYLWILGHYGLAGHAVRVS